MIFFFFNLMTLYYFEIFGVNIGSKVAGNLSKWGKNANLALIENKAIVLKILLLHTTNPTSSVSLKIELL